MPPLPPAATSQTRGAGRPGPGGPVETPPAPVAAPTDETPGAEAPAEGEKAHGPVRAAEHSNRSDVAALRQWINHPELRSDLALPDLSAEPKGNGFAQAVAAYQAIIAIGTPPATDPVVTDPAPTDPPAGADPVVSDPVVADPPAATDPAPVVDPDPLLDPALLPHTASTEEA